MSPTRSIASYPEISQLRTRLASLLADDSESGMNPFPQGTTSDVNLGPDNTVRSLPLETSENNRPRVPPTLPSEVLSKIFIGYDPPASKVIHLPPRRDLYPWVLGHVCHQWRKALWNSPDLWETIQILEPVSRDPQQHETNVWTMLSIIIARTTAIISLEINRSSYSAFGINNLLKSFGHRLRTLSVYPSSQGSLHTLLTMKPGSLPHLAELSLLGFGSNVRLSTIRFPTNHIRPNLPNLQTLIIDANVSITTYLPYFPLSQLSRLELTGRAISPSDVHYALQQCSSVVTAMFSVSEGIMNITDRQATGTILSAIKNITLSPRFTLDWNVFLAPLVLPLLTAFSVLNCSNSSTGLGSTFSPAISSLIDRSSCSLNTFSVSYDVGHHPDSEPPHPEISDLLQKMLDLETFASGYLAPSMLICTVHGSLTQLKNATWTLRPEGLSTLLNLLDYRIAEKTSSKFPRFVNVVCYDGEGFSSARTRYMKNHARYKGFGVEITVRNVENDDIRFVGDTDKEDDGSETESLWAAGLGDGVIEHSRCCCIQ